jgi:hypothetical protein
VNREKTEMIINFKTLNNELKELKNYLMSRNMLTRGKDKSDANKGIKGGGF